MTAVASRLAGDRSWRAAWRAVWVSRLLVWVPGVLALLLWGPAEGWQGFDPAGRTVPFGPVGDVAVGPAARWDAAWYLAIAQDGYAAEPLRAAFFPLYPLLVWALAAPAAAVGAGPQATVLAGVVVSLVCLLVGLWVVHRLTTLELESSVAGLAVLLVALFPTGWAFSAVYGESLFLALSAGSFYAGRLGRWRLAGLLGGLAAATRSVGVLLVVPLGLLYAYGPRADRPRLTSEGRSLRPRHPLRADVAWLALVPAGLAAYLGYLALATGRPLAPFTTGAAWHRELVGPVAGVWDGVVAALAGTRQLLLGARDPVFFPAAGGDPLFVAVHNVGDFAFLAFAVVATVGALRRLPPAYGLWALSCLIVFVSAPVGPEPLASLPRYVAVLFPLHMWLAAWARGGRRAAVVAVVSAAGLAVLSAAFATWTWVA